MHLIVCGIFVNRELANKDMQLTEIQDQLEAESCFSVSSDVCCCCGTSFVLCSVVL